MIYIVETLSYFMSPKLSLSLSLSELCFIGSVINLTTQNGFTHAFVVEFDNAEERDYYVNEDPVHAEFKTFAGEVLDKAQVIDFTNGRF